MLKKVLHLSLWICIIGAFVVSLGFATNQQSKMPCNNFEINIDNNTDCYFVEQEDIKNMLMENGDSIINQPMANIDINKIEKLLYTNPWIKTVDAYTGINGTMRIEVQQREALVRIINEGGESYYIDRDGKPMLWSGQCTPVVPIFTGNIHEKYNIWYRTTVDEILKTDTLYAVTLLDDIFAMAKFISSNKMWTAQVAQVYVNENKEFEIIPVVGNHRILFGDATDMEEKFAKLEVFYREGLNKTDWNAYDTVNVKYKNQVVCSKIN